MFVSIEYFDILTLFFRNLSSVQIFGLFVSHGHLLLLIQHHHHLHHLPSNLQDFEKSVRVLEYRPLAEDAGELNL